MNAVKPLVKIALNPHWYSRFWIRQFYELYRKREIRLRPLLTTLNLDACFSFEVDGKPCVIDISDHKTLALDPVSYFAYFKANYSPQQKYPANVRPCINGTTLTRKNHPPEHCMYSYDIVWLTGIGGGRWHKVAMMLALAELPLTHKLAVRFIAREDWRFAPLLREVGVEVWKDNLPYRKWLQWNTKGRWCILARGKHDCLSFKMIDYMSIGAAVVADYTPTTTWPVPLRRDYHFLSFDFSGPDRALTSEEFLNLRREYSTKAHSLLSQLQDETRRQHIASNNVAYFNDHIRNGEAARSVLTTIQQMESF